MGALLYPGRPASVETLAVIEAVAGEQAVSRSSGASRSAPRAGTVIMVLHPATRARNALVKVSSSLTVTIMSSAGALVAVRCCPWVLGAVRLRHADLRSAQSASSVVLGRRPVVYRPLPVVVAIWDFLTLFEHVVFGFVVGNPRRRRGLLAILGVTVCVLVVGVLVLGIAVGVRCHGCEFCSPVPGTQTGRLRRCRAARCPRLLAIAGRQLRSAAGPVVCGASSRGARSFGCGASGAADRDTTCRTRARQGVARAHGLDTSAHPRLTVAAARGRPAATLMPSRSAFLGVRTEATAKSNSLAPPIRACGPVGRPSWKKLKEASAGTTTGAFSCGRG